ncbi:pectinesterase, partial [Phenoliferia sp. Uapishka_3]
MRASFTLSTFLSLAAFAAASHDSPSRLSGNHSDIAKRCVGSISSLSDVAAAVKCTTVNINAFTVPVGKTFDLGTLLTGTTVNVLGTVTFATGSDWAGPLASVAGTDIIFNGNSHKWNCNGAYWWDGEGTNGGRTKPHPAFKVKITGKMSNVYLLNPPAQAFSVSNPAALTISGATVDVAAGNKAQDGFDVSGSTGLTITGAYVNNQDDVSALLAFTFGQFEAAETYDDLLFQCIAINDATKLTFTKNTCNGGHGISIGSIKTGKNVKGVTISGNTVTASSNGLRIKTYVGATSASVSNVVYSGNTITGCTQYGVVVEQDYTNEGATGTASNTVSISGVSFTGVKSTVAVASGAKEVYVLCGSTSCTGTWDWSKLSTSGGKAGSISHAPITGYTLAASKMKRAVTGRTTAPSGALVVSTSPTSGQFATIAAAIKSLGSSTKAASIFVRPGTYSGSTYITYGGKLTIYGYTADTSSWAGNKVTLTHDGNLSEDGNDDATGTLRVHSNGFKMYNINVVNSYGHPVQQSQALALSAYGTQQGYYGCSFVGYQDTVLTDTGTQLFAKSYIEGAVDYIFGQTANTWLDHCTIASKAAGAITASGRPSSSSTGIYVFNACTIKQAATATTSLKGLVYLGRPWTQYARAVFMFSSLSSIINTKGWEQWTSTAPNTSGVTFAEYKNTGAGNWTTSRATFSKQLTSTTVAAYTLPKILGSNYADWVDASYL